MRRSFLSNSLDFFGTPLLCISRFTLHITLFFFAIVSFIPMNWAMAADILIARSGQPTATIQIGADAPEAEQFAAQEIRTFIRRFTRAQLEILTNRQPTSTPTVIVLGTPESNPTILALITDGHLTLRASLGTEGYSLTAIELGGETVIAIAGNTSRGVIYGSYALIEACIAELTGLSPVDIDFAVQPSPNLSLPSIDEKSRPFYPIRATLETESADWLVRHRINMSGAEGVWTGTGSDDGLGTAFKYVDSPIFEALQDESRQQRQQRIRTLRNRLDALKRREIDTYLFMYVTGEPTKALIRQRPDLLGPLVSYAASRNGVSYRPFCWSKPEFHSLARQLVQEIVRTYPTLSGFHLRAWGNETRACDCPECGDRSVRGQTLLWEVLFTVINAALEIRPNFKFYISGYNKTWLKDEDSHYARQLPVGTIFSKKWGFDGEPVADPRVSVDEINKLGSLGHYLIVLSHDVEEAMPFWMLEGDLFAQGVRQLGNNPAITGLGGFTVQGASQGFGYLDRILSARMNWDIDVDHFKLLENDLSIKYGAEAAEHILNALRTNSWVLSSYFADYAGSLSFTGRYGDGSAGLATRFWDITGVDAVNDTLALPDLEAARHAVERFSSLLPQQLQAANKMEQGAQLAQPISTEATNDLNDAVKLMRIWVLFFESRLRLVEAVVAGYEADSENRIREKITSATEYTKSMLPLIRSMQEFVPIFGYSRGTIEASLLEQIEEEISWLSAFDPHALVRKVNRFNPEKAPLEISALRNYPNPFDRETTLIYELSRDVDAISITIYTTVGRRVRGLEGASAQEGYNEAMWDGRDEDDTPLANGVYFYRIRAVDGDEQTQAFSRLAILR